MVDWPILIRHDRNCMAERTCPHGIGHPDPDSLGWMQSVGIDDDGTHGCDGCCTAPGMRKYLRPDGVREGAALPGFVGDFWNHTQNVMEYLEAWVDIESDPERAGLLVHDIQVLKDCVNHYDVACGFSPSYRGPLDSHGPLESDTSDSPVSIPLPWAVMHVGDALEWGGVPPQGGAPNEL